MPQINMLPHPLTSYYTDTGYPVLL